jgi:putative FmdB family regulatory protein
MPLYEYQCDACAHRFEVIQKFSDAPIEVCPKCGGPVGKLLSSPAIQFKGSGWYITDYARAGKSEASSASPGKSEGKSDTGSTSTGDASSGAAESKTEAKAETKPKAESTPSAPAKAD